MLLRLLLAVLMLAGPVPVRFCTCAASATPPVSAEVPASQPLPETTACGCSHRAKQADTTSSDTDSAHAHVKPEGISGKTHPGEHDRECPAVKPRVAISDAVLTPGTDAPADAGFSLSVAVALPAGGNALRSTIKFQTITPSVPLFITLLTLRN
jgi:hypothetical protein